MQILKKEDFKSLMSLLNQDDSQGLKNYIDSHAIDVNINFSPIGNEKSNNSDNMLYYALRKDKLKCFDMLLNYPNIKVDQTNSNGMTCLINVIKYKKMDIFNKLIQLPHPGVNVPDSSGYFPITKAVQAKSLEMVQKIAQHPEHDWSQVKNNHLSTALNDKQGKIAQYIVDHPSFNPNIPDPSHCLGLSNYYFNAKIVKSILDLPSFKPNELIDSKYEKDVQEPAWWTPIKYINSMAHAQRIAKIVFRHPKVDLNVKNSQGQRLVELFISTNHATSDILIKDPKTDLFMLNNDNQTILEQLCNEAKFGVGNLAIQMNNRAEVLVNRILKEFPEKIHETYERLSLLAYNEMVHQCLSKLSHAFLQGELKEKKMSKKFKI